MRACEQLLVLATGHVHGGDAGINLDLVCDGERIGFNVCA
jgi:hypothetical protein